MNLKLYYDKIFGNNDGRLDMKDLPNSAVLIIVAVVDLVMLVAEIRVWQVGYHLTGSGLLAFGFVMVSGLPFYMGQITYKYNRANGWQQMISVGLVVMGLAVSAYYGFADYILATNTTLTVANDVTVPLDVTSLYTVAIGATVLFIVSGLAFALVDDEFAAMLKMNRIEGRAQVANREIEVRRRLLAQLKELSEEENALRAQYGEHYDELYKQFTTAASRANKSANPTTGNGTN